MSATTIIVNDETPRRQYTAAASQTNFDFPFPVFAAGDLQVYKTLAGATPDDTADILTLTTDYTVTGADTQSSCVVVLNSGAAAGDIITIIRVVDIARTSDYQIGGDLLAETINREQDTEIMIHQQLREELDRTLRLPITSTVALDAMPNFQAGQYLKVNAAGDAIEYNAGTNANQAAAVETQTLTSGQTSVVFTADVSPAAFYLSGPDVDSGRLTLGDDYTVTAATKTVTLTQSYPAGTKLVMVYVDGNADLYSVSSGEVSYAPSGTGAVTTTVEAKLRETVSVKDFGAVGDGVTDDTAAIQAAIDATVLTRGTLHFPGTANGNYIITSPLTISGTITITGDGMYTTRIVAVGCDAIQVNNGVGNVTLKHIELGTAVRYTTTTNALTGITFNGDTSSRPFNCHLFDVYIDGFYTAVEANWLWSSRFENVETGFGHRGIVLNGLSVNNVVTGCSLQGSNTAGSRGLIFGDGTTPTEGLNIDKTLFFNNEISIQGNGASNVYVSNNIIDFSIVYGIYTQDAGANASIGWNISGNYIAVGHAASGSAGIQLNQAVAGSNPRGNRIYGNDILVYSGGSSLYGIRIFGAEAKYHIIEGNTIKGMTTNDIKVDTVTDAVIANNQCLSSITTNISVPNGYVSNNTGVVSTFNNLFTPVAIGTSAAGTGTYTIQFGIYQIVDNMCHFSLQIGWSAHTGTGNLRIDCSGLPNISRNISGYNPICTIGTEGLTFPASTTAPYAFFRSGEKIIELRAMGSGIGATAVAMDTSVGSIRISGSYLIG